MILILLYFLPGIVQDYILFFLLVFYNCCPFYLYLYFLIFILFSEQFDMLSQILIRIRLFTDNYR